MTFDEWHKANAKYMEPVDIVDWCREAYEAGRKDENEACAKVAEQIEREIFNAVGDPRVLKFKPKIATAIRARGQE